MAATAHHRVRAFAIVFSCAIPVAIALAQLPFIRWIADDFAFANGLREYGVWGFQKHLYLTFAGRLTGELVVLCAAAAGRTFAFVVPLVVLAGLILVAASVARLASRREWIENDAATWCAATLLISGALLETAPDRYQPLFWLSGAASYGVPVLLMGAVLAWSSRAATLHRSGGVAISFIATFAAGCSETAAVCQVAGFTALLIASGRIRKVAAASLLGSLIGLLIVAGSPGNEARRTLLEMSARPMGIEAAVPAAISATLPTLLESVKRLLPFLVLAAAITRRAGASGKHPAPLQLVATIAAPCAVIAAALAAGYYSMGSAPPNRAMFIVNAWVVTAAVVLTVIFSRHLPSTPVIEFVITIAAIVATLLGPLRFVESRLATLQEVQACAASTDALDRFARAHPGTDVITPTPRSFFGLTFVTRDETAWPNTSVAAWYGLRSICWRDVPATTVRAAD